jgi:hypothetical protein
VEGVADEGPGDVLGPAVSRTDLQREVSVEGGPSPFPLGWFRSLPHPSSFREFPAQMDRARFIPAAYPDPAYTRT